MSVLGILLSIIEEKKTTTETTARYSICIEIGVMRNWKYGLGKIKIYQVVWIARWISSRDGLTWKILSQIGSSVFDLWMICDIMMTQLVSQTRV